MAVKWGVIGCGGIADRRTIPEGLLPSAEAELVAVQDVDQVRAQAVGKKYGIAKVSTHEQDIVDDPEVEAVYIATPTYLHH